ncbi:hypothetical protein MKP08_09905 [Erythrobacter sp. LQ02-29]|uniref:hypothetical protein n=1 Tax=Erythrobacter sp. LQ02-29 TaxID=2920384 RepID=UPI001F4D6F32|nr:hypothetical protein [Erythrobacter sp. LQ02-29]MCP9223061.1 hypothetical protein [Erythrobacter sp. LQ02-29]
MSGRGRFGSIALVALALAGCDNSSQGDATGLSAAIDNANPPLECAPSGAATFAPDCTLERVGSSDHWRVTNPDGSFHRLDKGDSPSGYVAAAGVDRGSSEIAGDYIVMTIGRDRYRWPAPKSRNAR